MKRIIILLCVLVLSGCANVVTFEDVVKEQELYRSENDVHRVNGDDDEIHYSFTIPFW